MNKLIYTFLFCMIGLTSCIEEYEIEDAHLTNQKIVISGTVSDVAGFHEISISYTSPLNSYGYNGVTGCTVLLVDNLDNTYIFNEVSPGRYITWLDLSSEKTDRKYRLSVTTNSCAEYTTDYLQFSNQSEVGNIYGERLDKESGKDEKDNQGVQFYYNFKGDSSDSRYYRFEIEETWEYHARYPIYYLYEDSFQFTTIGDQFTVCYRTQTLDQTISLSTGHQISNEHPRFKLHWVPKESEKFNHKYSILVKQYAINSQDYTYWNAVQQNEQSAGGLYNKQPQSLKGNIYCPEDSTINVLGNFNLVSVIEKRVTFDDNFGLRPYRENLCALKEDEEITEHSENAYPIYLVYENGQYLTSSKSCFDCRLRGGTLTKPDFW